MSDAAPAPDRDQLKTAFKAFKKKLKLAQLDAESRINRSPVTSGRGSGIVGLAPPDGYPAAVWDELVKQGRLKKGQHGTYELPSE